MRENANRGRASTTPDEARERLVALGWQKSECGGLWTRHDVPASILESSIESDPMRVLETARRRTGGE